jgi:hypothetical protein
MGMTLLKEWWRWFWRQSRLNKIIIAGLFSFVISMPVIAPMASMVLILKTPIDEKLRQFIYVDHGRVTIQVPHLSADQFGTVPLKISCLNAMKILNRERVLRTGDETFANEKIEFEMLHSDEPGLHDEDVSYQVLPKARACPDGTAGEWYESAGTHVF